MIISIMRPEFDQFVTLYKPKNKSFLHQEHPADVVSHILLVANLLLIEKIVLSDTFCLILISQMAINVHDRTKKHQASSCRTPTPLDIPC